MGSARLPGKVLAEIAGLPMLELIVRRVRTSQRLNRLIVATTELPADDAVESLCERLGTECFRGADEDCLDRLFRAAAPWKADAVVRLTGDNPVPDGEFVDWVIDEFLATPGCDFIDTTSSGSFPYGLSVEVVSSAALTAAWHEANEPHDREHVTPFVRRQPSRFVIRRLSWPASEREVRLTVDVPADLRRMDSLFRKAGHWQTGWRELVELARSNVTE